MNKKQTIRTIGSIESKQTKPPAHFTEGTLIDAMKTVGKFVEDETLKKIAHELTENLKQNLKVDWAERESVRANLRLMVKRILRKYKYPPDEQDGAVELVLQQVQALGEDWMPA